MTVRKLHLSLVSQARFCFVTTDMMRSERFIIPMAETPICLNPRATSDAPSNRD